MRKLLLIILLMPLFDSLCHAQLSGAGYYRIKSEMSGKYLSLVDNDINFQKIVGSASSVLNDPDAAMARAGTYIGKDILLVEEKEYNPQN